MQGDQKKRCEQTKNHPTWAKMILCLVSPVPWALQLSQGKAVKKDGGYDKPSWLVQIIYLLELSNAFITY